MSRPPKKDYLLKVISSSKGMTRKDVAAKSGTHTDTVWRIEVGKPISDHAAVKIAKALEISPDIVHYSMGRFPPDKIDFVIKDPLFFKALIDEVCAEPWRLTKTEEFIKSIKEIKTETNPVIGKLLNKLRPTE